MNLLKNKKFVWSAGIILTLFVIYFAFKPEIDRMFKKSYNSATDNGSNGETLNTSKVLQEGDKGNEVRELQRLLNKDGQGLAVDGDFGPLTKNALIAVKGVERISLFVYATNSAVSSSYNGSGINPNSSTKNAITRTLTSDEGSYISDGGFRSVYEPETVQVSERRTLTAV